MLLPLPWSSLMESPCVKICVYHPAAGVCKGCGRTLDELARWARMESKQRLAIMAELPARLAKLNSANVNSD